MMQIKGDHPPAPPGEHSHWLISLGWGIRACTGEAPLWFILVCGYTTGEWISTVCEGVKLTGGSFLLLNTVLLI